VGLLPPPVLGQLLPTVQAPLLVFQPLLLAPLGTGLLERPKTAIQRSGRERQTALPQETQRRPEKKRLASWCLASATGERSTLSSGTIWGLAWYLHLPPA